MFTPQAISAVILCIVMFTPQAITVAVICTAMSALQAIPDLQRLGYVHAVITQNVDRLHQKAGTRDVLEMHGTTHE